MKRKACRQGLTLLEIVISSSMLAVLLTSVSVILRTSRAAWDAHEADFVRIEAAHATIRHIVREIRQANSITAISNANDESGSLTLLSTDGTVKAWEHEAGSVLFGLNTATELLAPSISSLRFVGYRIDGATVTSDPTQVQCVFVEVTVSLPREAATTRKVSSWAWLRTWE